MTRNVFNIEAVDNTNKIITVSVAPTNPINSGLSWDIRQRRNNPGVYATSQTGGDNRGVFENNFFCNFDGLQTQGAGETQYASEKFNLGTGFIADGDGSVEDGGNGDTLVAFEDAFDGTSFKQLTEGNLVSTFTNKTSGPLDQAAHGTYGVGAGGGYVTWPANFETLPLAGTVVGSHPDRTPASWSFTDQTDVATSTADVANGTVQITSIDDGTPVRLSSTADASAEFRIVDTDNSTVVRDWGTAATTIDVNQYVDIRVDASASPSTAVTAELIVGNSVDEFSVTTASADISVKGTVGQNITTGAGTEDITLPGTPAENDIVIVIVGCDLDINSDGGINSGEGYTDIDRSPALEAQPAWHAAYKRMGSTPDTTVTIDQNASANRICCGRYPR